MKHFTVDSLIKLRLLNQQLIKQKFKSPAELVKYFGAIQAQDYSAAKWAIGLRLKNAVNADIEKAISERKIIRTWPIRGTLHFVAAEDVRWLLQLTPPKSVFNSARSKQIGLDSKLYNKSIAVIEKVMNSRKELTREELAAALHNAGINTNGVLLSHIIQLAGRAKLLCFGVMRNKKVTYTLLDDWVPETKKLTREEALVELAERYFTSHTPATIEDFSWWSGLTKTDAKIAMESIKPGLTGKMIGDRIYWFPKHITISKINSPDVHLLPWWDEYLVAYKDRSAVLDYQYAKRVNAGGGMIHPAIIIDGRVAGTWKREIKKNKTVISINPFNPFTKSEKDNILKAEDRYCKFFNMSVSLKS